jgi:dolichol-phosphate mannosyltransferase
MSRIKYAMDAVTSFSYKPLRLSFALFCFSIAIAGLMAFFMLLSKNSVGTAGFAVAASVFFVGGMLLLCLGVLGEYLGRVYDEVRSRPLSIISSVHRSSTMNVPQLGIVAAQEIDDQNHDAIDAA